MTLHRMVYTVLGIIATAALSTLLYWRVDLIHRGGIVMIPILMGSILAMAIALERGVYFWRVGTHAPAFFTPLATLVQQQRWQEAEGLCAVTPGPVARVALAGLRVREQPATEIERVMLEAAHEAQPEIEHHHRWLSTIAQVSTLLGLLGTVIGMVMAFQVIQDKATSAKPVNPGDLAGGIWQALLTTVAGLEVAIPTILAYNYLSARVSEVQYQMERTAVIIAHWRHTG